MTKRFASLALVLGAAAAFAAPAAPASAGCNSPTLDECIQHVQEMLTGPICICE